MCKWNETERVGGRYKEKKDNGIISYITPILSHSHSHTDTHTSTEVVTGDESTVWASLPSPPSTPLSKPPSSHPSPLTPNLPTLWARRAWRGWVYSVTFLTHWFFRALFDLLSQLPQPAKRGNIIHQRPLRRETIYCPPTQRHRSTNTHTYEHTQMYSMQERHNYDKIYNKPLTQTEKE